MRQHAPGYIHRAKRVMNATTDEERRRAERFSVRGLRHCHNVECAAHLNRDHNAAVNIQRRCASLLEGNPLPRVGDDVDRQLDKWNAWMNIGN